MTRKRKFSEGMLDDRLILDVLNISEGLTVLDAGCGNGYMAVKFSKSVGSTGKVYALDPEKFSISELKQKTANIKNITALVGDITTATVFENNSIDLVYLSTVFHIFSAAQVSGFTDEVNRILKPGGTLAIVNINKEETPFGPPLEMRSSPEELKNKVDLTPLELTLIGSHFYMQTFKNE